MADLIEKMKSMASALRKKTTQNPDNPKLKPLEKRGRGYQLYVKEQQALGEDAMPYEDWIAQQE